MTLFAILQNAEIRRAPKRPGADYRRYMHALIDIPLMFFCKFFRCWRTSNAEATIVWRVSYALFLAYMHIYDPTH